MADSVIHSVNAGAVKAKVKGSDPSCTWCQVMWPRRSYCIGLRIDLR